MFWNKKTHALNPPYSWLKLPEFFRANPAALRSFYLELFARIKMAQAATNFLHLSFETAVLQELDTPAFLAKRNQRLFGLPFFVKDNFAVKGESTEAGSRILENFIPNFDATVVTLLKAQGMVLVGKTNMDELGMGGTGLESCRGPVKQAFDDERITGGSSSGASVAIALNLVPVSLGSDTGNSVRLPASFVGLLGFKPTFGIISRFGLVQYSPSLDTVGIFTTSLRIMQLVTEVLAINDPYDFAMRKVSFQTPNLPYKIAVLGLNPQITPLAIITQFKATVLQKLTRLNYQYEILNLDPELTALLNFLYGVLTFPDALSSHANLTGFTFGLNLTGQQERFDYNAIIIRNRTAGLGLEVKKRYLLGAFYVAEANRAAIYEKALKMINFLKHRWIEQFRNYDFFLHPASAGVAPLTKQIARARYNPLRVRHVVDDYLLITNFLGWPSLVLPAFQIAHNWVGVNLFAHANCDLALLAFAQTLYDPKTRFADE